MTGGLGDLAEIAAAFERLAGACPSLPDNRILLSRIDSTNRMARTLVGCYLDEDETPPPLLVIAREQTAGRGRRGRSWASPAGGGLYATRVVPMMRRDDLESLPLLVPVALAEGVESILGGRGAEETFAPRCRIKWPNDLLLAGGKVGGILIESLPWPEGVLAPVADEMGALPAAAIIGFGVNVREAPEDAGPERGSAGRDALPPGATTIARHRAAGADPLGLGEAATALIAGLETALSRLGPPGGPERFAGAYRRLSVHEPGERLRCRIGEKTLEGAFAGFGERGFLRLERDDGETLEIATGDLIEEHAS